MEQQLIEIREQQKATWNKFSPGWKKWDELVLDFLRPMGDEIIHSIQPMDGQLILDIAAGTGEPGLTIAEMIPNGKVVITDLAEAMLEVAKENAAKKNIRNAEFRACDVSELPFPDDHFDSISCRMGFMFFPDMQLAANEMARVLKPGGKIATSVWDGPDHNFWTTVTMGIIAKHIQTPPPPPGAPGMFRCAQPGLMRSIFEKAGFKNISEKAVPSKMNAGNVDTYWKFTTEVAAPVVAALGKADAATQERIKEEVHEAVKARFPGGNVNIDARAIVIAGSK